MLPKIIQRLNRLLDRGTSASMSLIGSGLLAGCAALGSAQAKPPVAVGEVVQMTHEGVPAETIIARMRAAQTVYRLDAAELARLHDRGVADSVINYMQQTYLQSVRREQSRTDWDDWETWGDHYW
jgi:hypothetical protein